MHYRLTLNDGDGVLEAEILKACDPRTVDDYERQLLPLAAKARRGFGQLRLLIESSRVGLLPAETLSRLALLEERLLTRADDRVAIVVDSSISKAQLATLPRRPQVARFVSLNAARTWLLAHDARIGEPA